MDEELIEYIKVRSKMTPKKVHDVDFEELAEYVKDQLIKNKYSNLFGVLTAVMSYCHGKDLNYVNVFSILDSLGYVEQFDTIIIKNNVECEGRPLPSRYNPRA